MVGVLALSVSDQVVKIGAFIGIAAFIGLAALSLLYFAQARELKRLREWAGRAPERAQELQDRVVAEAELAASRRVQAAPQPRPAAATAPAVTAAATGKPGAVAPAAAAAKPTGEPGTPQAVPAVAGAAAAAKPDAPAAKPSTPDTPGTPAATPPGAPATAGPGTPGGAPTPATPGAPATPGPNATPGTPAPATAAASAPAADKPEGAPATPAPTPATQTNGSPPAGAPAPSTAAARGTAGPIPSDDTGEYTVEEDAVTPPPLPPPRRPAPAPLRANAAASRRPAPARPAPASGGRSGLTTALGVLAGILVLGGVAFGATQLLGGDDETTAPPNQPAPSANETPGSGAGDDEASTTPRDELVVHVLNGTTVSGLAANLADTLRNEGFAEPITGNNADQQRTESEVLYAEGRRGDARDVAEALDIDTVAELDPTTTTNSEGADIVVIVGADKAQ